MDGLSSIAAYIWESSIKCQKFMPVQPQSGWTGIQFLKLDSMSVKLECSYGNQSLELNELSKEGNDPEEGSEHLVEFLRL